MAVTLFRLPQTPLVNSISYGWDESLSCESSITTANCTGINSQQYNARADAELAKLAAIGVTVIVSSGDAGAPGDQNYDCSLDGTSQPLWPQYPACSPWVTTVSATVVVESQATSGSKITPPPICNMSYPCSDAGPGCIEVPCMIVRIDSGDISR
jgi:subtilase family serine protease